MTEERVSYGEIREWFLGHYYTVCRRKLNNFKRDGKTWGENESETGYSYYEFENAYDLPIEILMLEVFVLILYAGRSSAQAEKYHRDLIVGILKDNDFNKLMGDITEEEKEDLLYDMNLLDIKHTK